MASISIIVASSGNNVVLAKAIAEVALSIGHTASLVPLADHELPLFTVEREQQGPRPERLTGLVDALRGSDAWVVLAPEYNGSFPPRLNNAVAWLSREGEDFRALFRDRPVALGTHSGGGGQHVIMAMRMQFAYVGCNVVGRSLVVNKNKPVNTDSVEEVLRSLVQGVSA